MKLNDFLKVLGFFEISGQFKPVLLDNFLAEVVDKPLQEGQDAVVETVCVFKAVHISHFLHCLKHEPARTDLPFQKGAPQH